MGYWGPCELVPGPEKCNGCDDDGDGLVDEGIMCPKNCASCPTWTEVNWFYQATGGDDVNEIPHTQATYQNNVYLPRYVTANRHVAQVSFRVSSFDVHTSDSLDVGQWNGSLSSLTGMRSSGSWLDFSVSASLQETPLLMRFRSDSWDTSAGFHFDRARVCCQGTYDQSWSLPAQDRVSGVLLGDNDVVYFTMPTRTDRHITLTLWADRSIGNDFDVYVRCDLRPTKTAYDYFSWAGDYNSNAHYEFVHIEPTNAQGQSTCSGTWHVAVTSWRGSGWFNIVRGEHWPSQHLPVLRVGTNVHDDGSLPTQDDLNRYADTLRKAARRFFGATEGVIMIPQFEIYNNGLCHRESWNCTPDGSSGPRCHICFDERTCCGTGWCDGGCCTTFANRCDPWEPSVEWEGFIFMCGTNVNHLVHEMGHTLFCAGDEYDGSDRAQCGHSLMDGDGIASGVQNFCYTDWEGSTVIRTDHPLDGDPAADPTPWVSVWRKVFESPIGPYATTPIKVVATPDSHTYEDFHFNGWIGNVTFR